MSTLDLRKDALKLIYNLISTVGIGDFKRTSRLD